MRFLLILTFINFSFWTKIVAQIPVNGFGSAIQFSSTSGIQGIAMGDLNNDSKPEILTANISSGNSIRIFINATNANEISSSSFSNSFNLTTLNSSPISVKIVDLNSDGKSEIIVCYNSTSNSFFSIFHNIYNGVNFNSTSFQRYDISTNNTPQGAAFGDFDLDGKIDIAVSNYGSNNVTIYKNNSSTTALSFGTPIAISVGSGPGSIAAGDIDNDGRIDLATSNWSGNSISVLRNTNTIVGVISFSSITSGNNTAVQSNPNWVSITDFNQNGMKEVVCSNWGSNTISIYENVSTLTISFNTRVDLSISPSLYPQTSDVADFDGDGWRDLAVSSAGSSVALVFKNNYPGTGLINSSTFSGVRSFPTSTSPVGLVAGDLDSDGRPDMVTGNFGGQNISVFKNRMLAMEPTIHSTNIVARDTNSIIELNFTKGNGKRRLVICKQSSSVFSSPIDTNWYFANDTFGLGSNLGFGNYVVYNDTGSTVRIKGVTIGQTYNIRIVEYNGELGFSNYYNTSAPSITVNLADVFYSKSIGALNLLSTWGENPDGSGLSPASFNNANTVFIVANNSSPTITSNLVITGTGSYFKIGLGLNPLNFNIPSGLNIFADSIVISSHATLTFQGGMISNKAFFDSLSTAQFISSNAQNIPGFNYYNLIIAGGNKTLLNNIRVKDAFTMLTNLNTGIHFITIGESNSLPGSIVRSSGVINGRIRRWFSPTITTGTSGLFPIGTGTIYRPIQINYTVAPTIGGFITGEFISSAPGNSGLPIYDFSISPLIEVNKVSNSGYWRMETSLISGGQYTVTLTGTNFHGISSVANLRVVKRQQNGAWIIDGTAVAGSGSNLAPIVSRTGMQGIGEFSIAGDSTDNILPLNWLNFSVNSIGDYYNLSWATINEINCSHFEIESKDGESEFKTIGKLVANNNLSKNLYEWKDLTTYNFNKILYRVKQVDFDGKFTYSKIIIIDKLNYQNDHNIVFYPNPFYDIIYCKNCADGTYEVVDIQGKSYLIEFKNGSANLEQLAIGTYYFKNVKNSIIFIKQH